MAKQYYKFSRRKFEWELMNMQLGWVEDVTEELLSEGKEIWERVYSISTKNRSVKILVFSSIDIRTDYVRDHGSDMVRVVLQWKTKHGYVYKKVQHRERVKTLFKNLETTIKQAQSQVFSLNFREFSKEVV